MVRQALFINNLHSVFEITNDLYVSFFSDFSFMKPVVGFRFSQFEILCTSILCIRLLKKLGNNNIPKQNIHLIVI